MTDNAESYELTSGLADDFDCTVVDAWFATDSRYNNGNTTLLFWKIETDDEDMPDEQKDGGIRFSVGKDWESSDGGRTVEHPGGKNKFNNQSAIGTLLGRVMELGAGPTLMEAGPAQSADVWIGTSWHMKREPFTYSAPNDQGVREEKTGERLLPNAFNGKGEATSAPAATQAAPTEAAPSILDSLDASLVETLKQTKAENPTHAAFVDAAMELTEVTGNTTLVMALATPDGVYAEL